MAVMLSPMGTLSQYLELRSRLAPRTGAAPGGSEAEGELRSRVAVYHDKLSLLYFVLKRVDRGEREFGASWQSCAVGVPTPEEQEFCAKSFQTLRYDLSFFFVALKIAYDALAKTCAQFASFIEPCLSGQMCVPELGFNKLKKQIGRWANRRSSHVLAELGRAVNRGWQGFVRAKAYREVFVHYTAEAMVFAAPKRDTVFSFHELHGGRSRRSVRSENINLSDEQPMRACVRERLRDHYELAFELESTMLVVIARQGPRTVPASWFDVDDGVVDLYDIGNIQKFGVEKHII